MKRMRKTITVFALCVCLLLCMGVTAYAGGDAGAKYAITISPPSGGQEGAAFVTIRLEDLNGTGFAQAAAKLGEDGNWHDITESLRANGWAQFEIDRNGKVYAAVTDHEGKVHIQSLYVGCFGGAVATEPEPPEEPAAPAEPEPPAVSESGDSSGAMPTDGSGTVAENSVKTPGEREFYTIQSEKGNDYYIVVDKEKNDQNVYLLAEVTEDDLLGLTKPQEEEPAEAETEPATPAATEPAQPVAETPPAPEKGNSAGMIVVILLVVLAAGGAGYYFKIVRPKQDAAPEDGYADEDDEAGDDFDDYGYETDEGKEEPRG